MKAKFFYLLIPVFALFGACWPCISDLLAVQEQRERVFLCDSFTVGSTTAEVVAEFGQPEFKHLIKGDPKISEMWTYNFNSKNARPSINGHRDPRPNVIGIVHLYFENNKCISSDSLMQIQEIDRYSLSKLVEKRRLLNRHGPVGHSEKILSMQFGGAPLSLGYPPQSEDARKYLGCTDGTLALLGLYTNHGD